MKKIVIKTLLFFIICLFNYSLYAGSVTLFPYSINLKFYDDQPQSFNVGIGCSGFLTDENGASKASCFIVSNNAGVTFNGDAACNQSVNVKVDPNVLFSNNFTITVYCADNETSGTDTLNVSVDLTEYYNNYRYKEITPKKLIWVEHVYGDNVTDKDNVTESKTTLKIDTLSINVINFDNNWSYETDADWLAIGKSGNQLFVKPIIELFPFNQKYLYTKIKIFDSFTTMYSDVYILLTDTDNKSFNDKYNFKIFEYNDSNGNKNKEAWNIDNMKRLYTFFNISKYFDSSTDYSNKKEYLTISLDNDNQNVWAYNPSDPRIFIPVKINGVYVPGCDEAYFSKGKIDIIPFGPFTLTGFTGRVNISVNIGDNYTDSENHQLFDLYLSIYGIKGKWQLYDMYEGQTYKHPNLLNIFRDGDGNISGCFIDENNQCVKFLDVSLDNNFRYRLIFYNEDYIFEYEVYNLMETQLEGKWRWCRNNYCHDWEKFYGVKVLDLFNSVY